MKAFSIAALSAATVSAITLDVTNQASILAATSTIAYDMMTVYVGNQSGQVPGLLPGGLSCDPNVLGNYCWWEAGAMFGSLINYWQYTNDTSYNAVVSQALQFQKGADDNYNPSNQSRSMGVDDQAFWSFSAMDAVESNFPAVSGQPSWLSLAQAVFNFQSGLWDNATCGGGFRWQVYSFNAGYNLKNAVSNGGNFQLSARLAYVTGNASYADWANKVYDWMAQSKLMQEDASSGILYIWDNTDTNNGCIDVTNYVWTYNYGIMLAGAAYMYAYTNGSAVWQQRVQHILSSAITLFFPGGIMQEIQCEKAMNCDQDQKSFKAYLSRWMAVTSLLVPSTASTINAALTTSAEGAAKQCIGGADGHECGMQWFNTVWDGTSGVGQQMSALSVIGALLNGPSLKPLSASTGATSASNPTAGSSASYDPAAARDKITTGDKAGAAILTVVVIALVVAAAVWLIR